MWTYPLLSAAWAGKPTLRLTGGALLRLQAITPEGFDAQIDLALTDEYPLAQAFVVISAVPRMPSGTSSA